MKTRTVNVQRKYRKRTNSKTRRFDVDVPFDKGIEMLSTSFLFFVFDSRRLAASANCHHCHPYSRSCLHSSFQRLAYFSFNRFLHSSPTKQIALGIAENVLSLKIIYVRSKLSLAPLHLFTFNLKIRAIIAVLCCNLMSFPNRKFNSI